MNHLAENIKLMSEITNFLKNKNKNYSLWYWAIQVPIKLRIEELFKNEKLIQEAYQKNKKILENGVVFDLGCGFCPYWPFLSKLGYKKFVGIDLYTKRGSGAQEYMETAQKLIEEFCPDCEYTLIEGDIRSVLKEKEISNYNFLQNIELKTLEEKSFDLIYTKNTNYRKAGSTGIPQDLFKDICDKFLKDDGTKIYAG
jgi:SAM-dependent methyltransferase